jgi:hypothetical protein
MTGAKGETGVITEELKTQHRQNRPSHSGSFPNLRRLNSRPNRDFYFCHLIGRVGRRVRVESVPAQCKPGEIGSGLQTECFHDSRLSETGMAGLASSFLCSSHSSQPVLALNVG